MLKPLPANVLDDEGFFIEREQLRLTGDLVWETGRLGAALRWLRTSRRLSIRGVAALSGVAPSEIHKVERGQQECRIETLLKVCSILGATPGWVLDRSLDGNMDGFQEKILKDSDFAALQSRLKITSPKLAQEVALILAAACATFSILLRSSDAVSRSMDIVFPHEEWRKRFTAFAQKIAVSGENVDRASMLEGLASHPVQELSNHGLLPEIILTEQMARFGTPNGSDAHDFWDAGRVAFPSAIRLT